MIPSAQAYKYLHLNCDRVQANLEWINLSITKHQERPTRTGFVGQPSKRAEMSFVISVNTFEQIWNTKKSLSQCSLEQKGCEHGEQRQKRAVIKENAKYSFVELGKFNTRPYSRRISNSLVAVAAVAAPQSEREVRGRGRLRGRGQGRAGAGGSDFIQLQKGCNQSRGGKSRQKMNLMH